MSSDSDVIILDVPKEVKDGGSESGADDEEIEEAQKQVEKAQKKLKQLKDKKKKDAYEGLLQVVPWLVDKKFKDTLNLTPRLFQKTSMSVLEPLLKYFDGKTNKDRKVYLWHMLTEYPIFKGEDIPATEYRLSLLKIQGIKDIKLTGELHPWRKKLADEFKFIF